MRYTASTCEHLAQTTIDADITNELEKQKDRLIPSIGPKKKHPRSSDLYLMLQHSWHRVSARVSDGGMKRHPAAYSKSHPDSIHPESMPLMKSN